MTENSNGIAGKFNFSYEKSSDFKIRKIIPNRPDLIRQSFDTFGEIDFISISINIHKKYFKAIKLFFWMTLT